MSTFVNFCQLVSSWLQAPYDFVPVLGVEGALIRDIVSDADKLLAIGVVGVERCIAFVQEQRKKITTNAFHPDGVAPSEKEIIQALVAHGEEKLFIMLAHDYIRTEPGRALAKGKHVEMLHCVLERMKKYGDSEGREGREKSRDTVELERIRLRDMYGMGVVGEVEENVIVARADVFLPEDVLPAPLITRKEVRAYCRQEYGSDWWEVEPHVKKERMKRAKEILLAQQ